MSSAAIPSAFTGAFARWGASPALRTVGVVAGLLALGAFWGIAVAMAGLAAVLICASLIACVFVLRDFRSGVVLLILIMPISASFLFPHSMFGIGGLNPLNLLLVATLLSYLLNFAGKGALKGLASRPLVFLYVVPIVAGGIVGAPHVGQIPSIFHEMSWISYDGPGGYLRDLVLKPLLLVLFALLVGVGVARSRDTGRFLTPMLISMWVMGLMVIFFIAAAGVSLSQLAGTYERSFLSPLGMHANDLGRLYATAYGLLLFIWDRTPRHSLKVLAFASMMLMFAALVLTFSRGAFIAFALINAVYLVSRRKLKTLVLGLMAIPPFLFLMPGAVWSRLDVGMGQGVNVNAVSAGRVSGIWQPLVPDLLDNPIWGHGLQSILWSHGMRSGHMLPVTHPHSAFLQAVLDTGVIGLVLLLAFWFGHVWRGFQRMAREPSLTPELRGLFEGAAAGLLAVTVANVAGSSFFPVAEQSFTWLALGLMYGVRERLRAAAPPGAK
jgi:O-antigen ligase